MISINLLPPELEENKKKAKRKVFVARFSLLFLGFIIFLSIASLGLDIIQSLTLQKTRERVKAVESEVATYKDQEAFLTIIKNRLNEINSLISSDSPQAKAFSLVTALLPSEVKILTFSVDKKGQVLLSGETNNISSLQTFFNNLTEPTINQNTVTKVEIGSLSYGQNGRVRFDLVINLSTNSLAVTKT